MYDKRNNGLEYHQHMMWVLSERKGETLSNSAQFGLETDGREIRISKAM